MSKKKAFSGNTMTLKDFHGGSIPSDISLPSAPGVIVRPVDRPVFDRQNAWGNPMIAGRSDNRLRPSSSGSIRNLDDNKTPFLSNNVNIGRNFDEDERKPLDGGTSAPRRTVSDESFGGRSDLRVDSGKLQSIVGPVVPPQSGGSYSARVVEGGQPGGGGVGGGSVNLNSRPNAWGVRKEPVLTSWGGQSAVSKFAQASALDQISSGRWQTKPLQQQVEVEVSIRPVDSPNGLYGKENDSYITGVNFLSEKEYYETTLVRHVERGLSIEEGIRGVERAHSPVQSSVLFTNEGQPANPDGKFGGSELQQSQEVTERPKLKLLPRSKPLDVQEMPNVDQKPGFQQPIDTSNPEAGGVHGNVSYVKPRQGLQQSVDTSYSESGVIHVNGSHVKPRPSSSEAKQGKVGVNSAEGGNHVDERPKLNLKPRSQPVGNLDRSTEKERTALFGGARPREMVLKERGVDDVVTSHDEIQAPTRVKNEGPRGEAAHTNLNTSRQGGERVDNHHSVDQRAGRAHDKRDQRSDIQRPEIHKKNNNNNRRNDNWRSGQVQDHHERQPSPETWRKPVDQSNTGNSGLRFGKVVSAVDVAQSFSRSVSGPKSDPFSGQKGHPPARSQIPFSRLTGPTTRAQINGY